MRALVMEDSLQLRRDHPVPRPCEGEALVRVLMCGICSTDHELVRGYMGYRGVLGHEFVGIVEEAADEDWMGRRVVGEINCGCGTCADCLVGDPRHCARRTVLGIVGRDGVFADRVALPVRNLHAVPDAVSTEDATFVEPVAAAFEILEQVHLRPTDRVLVLGDGKLGLLTAQVLALTQCELTLVGRHAPKLDLARAEGLQAMTIDQWTSLSRGPCDVVVDCTGSADGLRLAMEHVRPRGTLVLKTTVVDSSTVYMAPLVVKEIRVVGSRCGPFAPALRALARGLVKVAPLVSATHDLDDGVEAFRVSQERGVVKVLLRVAAI